MRFKDLEVGMLVVIIDFGGSDFDRPEHWSAEMDDWQGHTVTIADFDDEFVYIREDKGAWSWYPDDFDIHCNLKYNNPNISYRRHKSDRRFKKMRSEWELKQIEEKAKKPNPNPYLST
jgi:hypothetical protein